MAINSRIPGLRDSTPRERRAVVASNAGIDESVLEALDPENGLDVEKADHMIENAIGVIGIPV